MATARQAEYINDLIDRKDLFKSVRFFEAVNAMDSGELKLYVDQLKARAASVSHEAASKWIDQLKALPDRTGNGNTSTARVESEVPAGRYAVTGDDGTTDFYKVDRPTEGRWDGYTFVKLQLSNELHRVGRQQAATILAKIEVAGPKKAMLRYGQELGHCGHCGRTLTNELSRELGIGPVCRGHMGW